MPVTEDAPFAALDIYGHTNVAGEQVRAHTARAPRSSDCRMSTAARTITATVREGLRQMIDALAAMTAVALDH